MNSLLRSLPLVALLLFASCTTTNITNVMNPVIAPTITRFSPDTAWTLQELAIYGSNFGNDALNVLVTIDTTRLQVVFADDTLIKALIPERSRSGLIRVRTYEQTATSAKPVTIRNTFNPHAFSDSLPEGASFSIPGSGMNNYRGTLDISINQRSYPIDSVFADRIVSHVVPNSYTGAITISDDDTSYTPGTLYVTSSSSWNTFSQIWNRLVCIASRHLTGYINGPSNRIDSTWDDTTIYDRQIDISLKGKPCTKTQQGLSITLPPTTPSVDTSALLQINWSGQYAALTYNRHSIVRLSQYHTVDTEWYIYNESFPTTSALGGDIEFVSKNLRCEIIETTTDPTGSVYLQKFTWMGPFAPSAPFGEFDLILKR